MHTTSIQKLSFILFIFTNTQVYATDIRTLKDPSKEESLNTLNTFIQKNDQEREKLRQQLLEKRDYYNKKKNSNELRKQARKIACIKLSGVAISMEGQKLLNTDERLGKEIRNIEQSVEQQVVIKYPYSGKMEIHKKNNVLAALCEVAKDNEALCEAEAKRTEALFDVFVEETEALVIANVKEIEAFVKAEEKKRKAEEKKRKAEEKKRKAEEKKRKAEEKEEEALFIANLKEEEALFIAKLEEKEKSFNNNSNSNPQNAEYQLCEAKAIATTTIIGPVIANVSTAIADIVPVNAIGRVSNQNPFGRSISGRDLTMIVIGIGSILYINAKIKNKKVPDNRKTATINKKEEKFAASRKGFFSFLKFSFFVYIIKKHSKIKKSICQRWKNSRIRIF